MTAGSFRLAALRIGVCLLILGGGWNLNADEIALEDLVEQLGAPSFKQRQLAREAIQRQLEERHDETVAALEKRLESAEDPEIRISLKSLLKGAGRGILVATYTFDEKASKAEEWIHSQAVKGGNPIENGPPIFLDEGIVEINSLKGAGECSYFTRTTISDNAKHRTVFEAKVKIVDPGTGNYGSVLTVSDNVHSENLLIYPDGLGTYNRRIEKVKLKTVGIWRTYRLEAEKDTLRVFVDDGKLPLIEMPWTRHATHGSAPSVRFGDTGSHVMARAFFKDINVSIYEIE